MLLLTFAPAFREQILTPLANPNLALLLLFAGILLIFLEFNRPGAILPGAVGTILVLTSIYALDQLPIRPSALLLVLTSFTLIALELKFSSHGILTLAGIAALTFGTLTLIDSPLPAQRIHPAVALGLCASFCILTVLLLRLALRARRQKALTGAAALVGSPATTLEPIETRPTGHILVQGEIWQAIAAATIAEKAAVRVTGHQGDILEVELAAE